MWNEAMADSRGLVLSHLFRTAAHRLTVILKYLSRIQSHASQYHGAALRMPVVRQCRSLFDQQVLGQVAQRATTHLGLPLLKLSTEKLQFL